MNAFHDRRVIQWLNRVSAEKDVPSSAFKVAYVIARHGNDETCGVSKPAVIRAIALLEAQGWIAVDRTSGIKNVYTLLRMREAVS
jgi:hypothetical protein